MNLQIIHTTQIYIRPAKPPFAHIKRAVGRPKEYTPPPPVERPSPVVVAFTWLDGRIKEKQGYYCVDGVPRNLDWIMREVNRMRVISGEKQIDYCDRWVINE